MKKVNWGIVGLGNIALEFASSFKNINNGQLVSIASKDPNKIRSFKEKFKIKNELCFNNYEDLLNSKEVEAVYIALPNSLHYYWVINCIKKSKRILVEKPATLNMQEMQKIEKELSGKNLFFAEAFMYRYLPQIKTIIELIKDDRIGNIISMESVFGKNIMTKKNLFGFKKKKKINLENRLFSKSLGGGAILDLGCYPVSFSLLVASLLPNVDIENVKIINKKKEMGNTNVDIEGSIILDFSNKFKCELKTSFKNNLGKKTTIYGEKGHITIEDTWHGKTLSIRFTSNADNEKEIKIESNKSSYECQLEEINYLISQGKSEVNFPGMKINETLLNMKILDAWRS